MSGVTGKPRRGLCGQHAVDRPTAAPTRNGRGGAGRDGAGEGRDVV